jgi:flagellar motor protein MotB
MEASRMHCPVCPARDLEPGVATCPACGTDLGPLRRVRELAARATEPQLAPTPVPTGAERSRPALPAGAKIALAAVVLWVPISVALLVGKGERPRSATEDAASAPAGSAERSAPETRAEATSREAISLAQLLQRLEGIEAATATREGEAVRLVFVDGIFASGSDAATATGLASLRAAGRALAGAAGAGGAEKAIVVDVVGACDDRPTRPGGPWRDNWALALGRARAAAEVLRVEAGAAPIRWRVSSGGGAGTPWANDTEAGRSRNRTVVLYVAWAANE